MLVEMDSVTVRWVRQGQYQALHLKKKKIVDLSFVKDFLLAKVF